jgi:hypothetical protein
LSRYTGRCDSRLEGCSHRIDLAGCQRDIWFFWLPPFGRFSFRAHTPARLTSAQQSGAVVSGAEKLSSRHVLPRDLSNALKQLDDGELDRFFEATRHELQRRGRLPTSTPVIRSTTHMGTEQRASDQSTTTEEFLSACRLE